MNKATFRKKLMERTNEALEDFDDEASFSDFWSCVQEHIDDVADEEDSYDRHSAELDEDEEFEAFDSLADDPSS